MTPWSAGLQLGPYVLVSPVGAGGMGEVWKARDTRLDRIVAIKRLKTHTARFEQEARAIAALNHPHICTLHDVGPDYLVMEFVEGQPLRGPMPIEDAVRLARQIAEAMAEAHSKGILHRDLKPGNILQTRAGVKVLDFGLAKLATGGDADATQTIEGTVLGTAAYMSPEQAKGKPLDERSDIFSFGAVLYEMLSGQHPFKGGSTVEVLSAVLRDEPAPLNAPAALTEVVKRCLAKRVADRFQSMLEVRGALEEIRQGTALPHSQPSIAVLPFANMSGDKEQEYFSDGLAEEIINALVKISGLKVIARTSAFAFKGQNTDIRKIAETLGVANILEGSVRRSGNRIRVTAQLITAADGSHLWSERYDRELADVFAVQDEISASISAALHTKLSPQLAAKPRYTPKLPAYEALLKARHFHWKVTPEAMAQAKDFYEQAIALDPQYALAQAVYADFLFGRAATGLTPAQEAMPAARAMAQRALELDPSLPEAHAILCAVAAVYDYDWNEAARRFALATARDVLLPWDLAFLGLFYLLASGQKKEAIEQAGHAVQRDPLHPGIRIVMASCLGASGQYVEAEAHLRQILDLDPNFFWAHYFRAEFYTVHRMFAEALPFAEKAHSIAPWYSINTGALAALLMRTGEQGRGKEILQSLRSGQTYATPMGLAVFHLYCGELDSAADWFEKAIEERYPGVAQWLQFAIAEPLRASPRWPKLAALMNLPDAG
jgi:TolB-like protein/tetratricopeptide (TPR) repeat protein/predicted Ser/Thr protein kinase